MRIRLKVNVFGAWTGKAGDEVERPDAEAAKLIARHVAEEAPPAWPDVTPVMEHPYPAQAK